MTRGRDSNAAYLYQRVAGEGDHEHADDPGLHVLRRGSCRDAAQLIRGIIANRDDRAYTAHDIAASTDPEQLPDRVGPCSNGVPELRGFGEAPTGTGMTASPSSPLNGSGGWTETSTGAGIGAWTTASISKGWPLGLWCRFRGGCGRR